VKCISNQKQIGIAFQLYADENREKYPVHSGWADVGGQGPTNAYTGGPAATYAGATGATNRPLNTYAKNVEIFHCPSDKGDAFNLPAPPSCWLARGNSYLVEWNYTRFAVERVTGDNGLKTGSPAEPTLSTSIAKSRTPKSSRAIGPGIPTARSATPM
jgi:hypothetical protein